MEYGKDFFAKACGLWTEWNSKINVVSRKDIDKLYEHHILHSLCITEYLRRFEGFKDGRFPAGSTVLDVGTGGGFPGIPLAMVNPETGFTLCDSVGKKILVAGSVAEGLGLTNVECANCRAEDLGREFDWVVSRAVTSLENFYPWVKGRYKKGILYLKGGDVAAEISDLCSKCRLDPGKISVWKISDWLEDEYFSEKFVIKINI